MRVFLLISCLVIFSGNANADLHEGLVAFYPFNGNANDESGYENHCSIFGALLTSDRYGIENAAFSFDGIDDYLEVADDDILDFTSRLTLILWIKQHNISSNGYRLIDKTTAGINNGYLFDTLGCSWPGPGNKMRFVGGVVNTCAESNYQLNVWHHLAVVFEEGHTAFYLDGYSDGEGWHGDSYLEVNSLSLLIGRAHSGSSSYTFHGVIDDISIYNRALSEAEILLSFSAGIAGVEFDEIPSKHRLFSNVPNPFNPQTVISYDLPRDTPVRLTVFDLTGRSVRRLRNGALDSRGRHEVVWNGRDDNGRQVASGTYFYRLEAGSYSETKRMVLIK